MYQYKAVLQKSKEVIATGHSIEDLEKGIKHFKREQKHNIHTNMNNKIEIYHVFRDEGKQKQKEKLIKVV